MGEITVPFGLLNNCLKPGPFVSFKVSPPGRAGIKQLCNQGDLVYRHLPETSGV